MKLYLVLQDEVSANKSLKIFVIHMNIIFISCMFPIGILGTHVPIMCNHKRVRNDHSSQFVCTSTEFLHKSKAEPCFRKLRGRIWPSQRGPTHLASSKNGLLQRLLGVVLVVAVTVVTPD